MTVVETGGLAKCYGDTLAGTLLAFLGYGRLALLISVSVRGTGASIGVWFLYAALGRAASQAGAAGNPPPQVWEWEVLRPVTVGWAALFFAAAFLFHRRRDL